MKKGMVLIMTVALMTMLVGIGFAAVFSDTETSTGNTFTAGTLDLKVDGSDDPQVVHIVRENMKPQTEWTYQGYNNQWVLKNAGSLPGKLIFTVKNVENYELGCNEPEITKGDTTCGTGADQGELGQYTWFQWSRNQAPWGSIGSQYKPLNSGADVEVMGPTLAPGETLNAYFWLDFPIRMDNMENLAQGDKLEFDIEFKLVQE